ncbi:MAG TPA: glycerophosphodiester phosphodiesterase family protein [Gammaproteobacteria bacterium]|nr:glycerophosphodiester phosphodiesterase family protein [Gammaproteobacteria bacterium]
MVPQKIPTLVGHRGWPARYPENTLEGFAAAVAAGARWLECDVQLSADHVPFVCHDASLRRTAGRDLDITTTPARELDAISVGEAARFGARFAAVRLARLTALAAWLIHQPGVTQFVEIKRQSLHHHGIQPVVDAVMAALQPALQQCVVISFDHACLVPARRQGAARVGWAVEAAGAQIQGSATDLQPDYMFTDEKLFARMRAALPGPWQWIVYHTEDAGRVLELTTQGAAMVETNDIGTLLTDARMHAP